MKLGIEEKPNAKILVQGNLGQLNYAETGNIDAHQTINQGENNDIQKVAQELIQLLKETSIENPDVKEDALDFVEEQSVSPIKICGKFTWDMHYIFEKR
ncbi:hypothetical protein [Bacillus mycoides]|uniref:hypothetical protein n=1 Tax=Bacillus mycoides TaxID=1405 RepID=UPI002E040181|nr:hypothetical protein [Bacillus mycoides]MEC5263882.1 hypothetical protein [Bacillus mycoides]